MTTLRYSAKILTARRVADVASLKVVSIGPGGPFTLPGFLNRFGSPGQNSTEAAVGTASTQPCRALVTLWGCFASGEKS
jgi:hypothetical protein